MIYLSKGQGEIFKKNKPGMLFAPKKERERKRETGLFGGGEAGDLEWKGGS